MKLHITIFLTLLLCVSLTVGVQAQLSLPVTDNFPSTGSELTWNDFNDSAYDVIESFSPTAPSGDGYVMNINDALYWQILHLADDDGSLGDYKIEAYIYVSSSDGTNWGRFGVFARATSIATDAGYYYLFCDSDADDYLRCGYYDEGHGAWTQLLDPLGSITRDAWHKFELSLMGDEIVAEIDDVEVFSGTDSTYSTGYIGILCYQQTASAPVTYCDRVTITANVPTAAKTCWSIYE